MKRRPLVRVPGDRRLEKRLAAQVRRRLRERRAADADYASLVERQIAGRPPAMTRFDFARFALWHRQFLGLRTPGLPFLVGTARQAARRFAPALDIVPALVRLVRHPS